MANPRARRRKIELAELVKRVLTWPAPGSFFDSLVIGAFRANGLEAPKRPLRRSPYLRHHIYPGYPQHDIADLITFGSIERVKRRRRPLRAIEVEGSVFDTELGKSAANLTATRLPRAVRDKSGDTLRTDDDAKQYVLEKLKTRPGFKSWKRAAQLLLDKAPAETITQQIEFALLLEGDLDVEFAASAALAASKVRDWP